MRREVLEEVQCLVLLKHILYEEPHRGSSSDWECQLLPSSSNATSGEIRKLDGLDTIGNPGIVGEFKSGTTLVTIPGGVIHESSIFIPAATFISVDNNDNNDTLISGIDANVVATDNIFQDHVRRLVQGNKRVIVIRVVDSNSVATASSAAELGDSVFGSTGDPHNLASRFKACSFNKLILNPVSDLGNGNPTLNALGVYEVKIPLSAEGADNAIIREKVTEQLNIDWPETSMPRRSHQKPDESSPFDYALYCLPPGTKGSWFAYAYANSWLSVYNGKIS